MYRSVLRNPSTKTISTIHTPHPTKIPSPLGRGLAPRRTREKKLSAWLVLESRLDDERRIVVVAGNLVQPAEFVVGRVLIGAKRCRPGHVVLREMTPAGRLRLIACVWFCLACASCAGSGTKSQRLAEMSASSGVFPVGAKQSQRLLSAKQAGEHAPSRPARTCCWSAPSDAGQRIFREGKVQKVFCRKTWNIRRYEFSRSRVL